MDTALKYQQIAAAVRQAVEEGALKEGTVLLESAISAIFTASRTSVRQALSLLEAEGHLHRFDGRGLVVGPPGAPLLRKELSPKIFGLEGPVALRRRSWDSLYLRMEHDLLLGSASRSRKINESGLAKFYQASRSLAAQMLARAERSGIVRRDDNGRLMTAVLDSKRVADLFALRAYLEPEALINVSLDEAKSEFLHNMRTRLAKARAQYSSLTPYQIRLLEYDLHVACIDLNANDAMARAMVETRSVFLINIHSWDGSSQFPCFDPLITDHDFIIEALIRQNIDEIRKASADHNKKSLEITLRNLDIFKNTYKEFTVPFLSD